MESRTARGIIALAFAALTLGAARAAVSQETGAYALPQGKTQLVSRLSLEEAKTGPDTLLLVQYPLHSRAPVTRYNATEGEPVHVIIVRDDFKTFGHLHPQAAGGGTFRLPVPLENGHRYYTYVVSRPAGLAEQVFRFVLELGAVPHHLTTTVVAPVVRAKAGPYDVSLDQQRLHASHPQILTADITRSPRAPGIAPYHVASVHAFLINTSSLTYTQIDGATARGICCEYAMRLPALAKGLYRMWLQFDDGNSIYTAPFTFAAQ